MGKAVALPFAAEEDAAGGATVCGESTTFNTNVGLVIAGARLACVWVRRCVLAAAAYDGAVLFALRLASRPLISISRSRSRLLESSRSSRRRLESEVSCRHWAIGMKDAERLSQALM